MSKRTKLCLQGIALLAIFGAVVGYCAHEVRTGGVYASDALSLGMYIDEAEEYRLYCLGARVAGEEIPSPYAWARERCMSIQFRPGSELEVLKHQVWLPEINREAERKNRDLITGPPD